jgi:hypothetical protein
VQKEKGKKKERKRKEKGKKKEGKARPIDSSGCTTFLLPFLCAHR